MAKMFLLEDVLPIFKYNKNYYNEDNQKINHILLQRPDNKRFDDEAIQDYLTYVDLGLSDDKTVRPIITGIAHPKKDLIIEGERYVYPRNRAVALKALSIAEHRCEIDGDHLTFISKRQNVPYTEPHHLIPLAFADNFDVSLDVTENIISLCSNCHNQLHYGKDISEIIKKLYESRKDRLERVGIKVSFDDLLWMYDTDETGD